MNLTHHLCEETLQEYAAGALSARIETLVACHLTVCPLCRQKSAFADSLGGALLDSTEVAAVNLSAQALLSRAAAAPTHAAPSLGTGSASHTVATDGEPVYPADRGDTDVPRPLRRLLPTTLDQLDWSRIAPGIRQYNLSDTSRKEGAFKLLHLKPGTVLSDHTHTDRELTYVVRGSYTDSTGRFAAGDIADLDGDHTHKPVVDSDEPCIALIASHAPVRFNSLFGKMIQPFVGI